MLTERGHKQAEALVPRMIQSGITHIYSSPLRRARETAEPTAKALGLPINIEPWMSENLAFERFHAKYPDGRRGSWIFYRDDVESFVRGANHDAGDNWPDIEPMNILSGGRAGYEALMAESDEFMSRLGYERDGNEYRIVRPNDDRVAVFCHQGFGLSWLSHLLRIPPNIFWLEFDMTHTGVTVLRFQNKKSGVTVPKCLVLSDMSHLLMNPDTEYLYHSQEQI